MVMKDELRHCAKFSRNRSNHGGDMSVFDFSRWRRRHLEFSKFQIFNGRNGQKRRTASACQCRQNRSNRGRDVAIFDFS